MREDGCEGAQFTAAEKGGKGMALKIFTEAKPSLKANMKPSEIEMLASRAMQACIICPNKVDD
jgi:hypothetical protein